MDAPIAIFEPSSGSLLDTFWLALMIGVGSAIGALILWFRKPSREAHNRTQLAAMLLSFVALIALGTAWFSWLTEQRNETLRIYADGIAIGNNKIGFDRLDNAVLEPINYPSRIPMQQQRAVGQVLLVAYDNGTTVAFSSEYYPVTDIMGKLRASLTAWNKQNK